MSAATGQKPVKPGTPAEAAADKAAVIEDRIKLAVLGGIMLAALAASFTHMHDWTMKWMPEGTPGWFGWANAVISELVPLVATLSLRQRIHAGGSLLKSYALYILIAGAMLSLAAQLASVGSHASWSARFLACLPSIAFLVLSKLVIGDLDAGRKQTEAKDGWEQKLRDARAETATVRRELADMRRRAEGETARAEAETAARIEAETRAADTAARAETETEKQAEILREAQAEIRRLNTVVRDVAEARDAARQQASEQTQAAGLAQGRLAEAREAADRAAAARVAAEQRATDHMRQVSASAQQTERDLRDQLTTATGTAQEIQRKAAQLAEQVREVTAQRDEARAAAERQSTGRVLAEQKVGELERARDAAFNEIERLRRQLARAAEKAETSGNRQPEISRAPNRKRLVSVPAALPAGLPEVETVKPETVAIVLAARAEMPGATQAQISEATGISDRTIRKVINALPANPVLELTDGRVA